ncbi:MAG TPA: phosphatidate cytidylyltransferase, partial [Acidimicrobiales bacterium]|nr:phosphatidate cytidylyltransferase [Acidimicrobiales bacterium]
MRRPPEPARGEPASSAATQLLLIVVFAGATAAAAQLGVAVLLVVVAGAAGIGAVELGTDFGEQRLATSPLLYVAGAIALPVAAFFWREPGVTAACAAVVLLAAARFVLARPERGSLLSIAAFVLASIYLGFGAAFIVLIDRRPHGPGMVAGLVILALLFHAGRFLGDRLGRRSLAPHLAPAPTVPGIILGVIGCLIGSAPFLTLAKVHVRALPALQIGLATAAALTVGAFAWALIRSERLPTERSIV